MAPYYRINCVYKRKKFGGLHLRLGVATSSRQPFQTNGYELNITSLSRTATSYQNAFRQPGSRAASHRPNCNKLPPLYRWAFFPIDYRGKYCNNCIIHSNNRSRYRFFRRHPDSQKKNYKNRNDRTRKDLSG